MSTYVLLPGAGGDSWYWHRVEPLLRKAGHDVIAPDLPASDDSAGLSDYVDVVVEAVGGRGPVVVVAQSMAGIYAPLLCDHIDVQRFVLVAPMIPAPGETGGEWWSASGQADAQEVPFDPIETFLHDVPPETLEEALRRGEPRQSGRPFADPWPLERWPDVPTRVIAGRHDRLFPLEFMRRLSRERLGVDPEIVDSGHLPALANPDELTALLLR